MGGIIDKPYCAKVLKKEILKEQKKYQDSFNELNKFWQQVALNGYRLFNKKGDKMKKYKPTGSVLVVIDLLSKSEISFKEAGRFFTYLANNGWYGKVNNYIFCGTMDQIVDYASDKPCFIKWLVDNGYAEEVKDEVFYKIGDTFVEEHFGIYILAHTGEKKVQLIGIDDSMPGGFGDRWNDGIVVADVEKISESEIKRLFGDGRFVKITK